MLFDFCKCPKCKVKNFSPSFEDTVESYLETEVNNELGLILSLNRTLGKTPEYLVFKCEQCQYTENIMNVDALKLISKGWAEVAYQMDQIKLRRGYEGGEGLVNQLVNENLLVDSISEEDLQNNPWLRDVVNNCSKVKKGS